MSEGCRQRCCVVKCALSVPTVGFPGAGMSVFRPSVYSEHKTIYVTPQFGGDLVIAAGSKMEMV